MTEPAAIEASYADFKLVKGRKVAQVVLEIPIERAENFVATFGIPSPATETPVALALLDKKVARFDDGVKAPRMPREWHKLPYSEQAAILGAQPKFRRFLSERDMLKDDTPEGAATAIRFICSVNSRADIKKGTPAERSFLNLYAQFKAWEYMP